MATALADEDVAELGKHVDLEAFVRYWALESILNMWDGYSGKRNNNFYVYADPANDNKLAFIPQGPDYAMQSLEEVPAWVSGDKNFYNPDGVEYPRLFFNYSGISKLLSREEKYRTMYKKQVKDLVGEGNAFDETWLLDQISAIQELLKPYIHVRSHDVKKFIEARTDRVLKDVAEESTLTWHRWTNSSTDWRIMVCSWWMCCVPFLLINASVDPSNGLPMDMSCSCINLIFLMIFNAITWILCIYWCIRCRKFKRCIHCCCCFCVPEKRHCLGHSFCGKGGGEVAVVTGCCKRLESDGDDTTENEPTDRESTPKESGKQTVESGFGGSGNDCD